MDYDEKQEIIDKNNFEYTKKQYEKMGIKVIEEYNNLLYSVELPEGWKTTVGTSGYWTDVFDEKGRKRMSFFEKLCFWDSDAFTNFNHRYSFIVLPFDEWEGNASYEERMFKPWTLYITDGGEKKEKLHEITPTTKKEYFAIGDVIKEIATKWLNEHYPDWENIEAYWD